MTAFTSTQSGLFSANSTWGGGGHPSVNGDTFTIASGHTVTQDTDFSGLTAGFGASVITGALINSQSSTNILQMNGNLTGTGTITYDDGAGGGAPLNVVSEILMRASGALSVSGGKVFRATQPTHKWVKLTQAANAADTVLHIDTDLTQSGDNGSNQWVLNSLVNIDNDNKALQTEQKIISSVTSTTLTLTAGLTNAKSVGAYIILLTRNVKILGVSTAISLCNGNISASDVYNCEVRTFNIAFSQANASATFGGVYSNGVTVFTSTGNGPTLASGGVITGATTQAINGSSFFTAAAGSLISGCAVGFISNTVAQPGKGYMLAGIVNGCTNVAFGAVDIYVSGTLNGNATGLLNCQGEANGATFSNNANAISASVLTLRGPCTFSGNTQDWVAPLNGRAFSQIWGVTPVPGAASQAWDYWESIDDGGVAGAYLAITKGNTSPLDTVATPVYDNTRARSYRINAGSSTQWQFFQREILVPAGGTLDVRCYMYKDASEIDAKRLRLWIFDAAKEPLQSGSPDVENIMPDVNNTWQVVHSILTNSTNSDKYYKVRILVMNNTHTDYLDPVIRVSSFIPVQVMEGGLSI
jgi:hypothetical protein